MPTKSLIQLPADGVGKQVGTWVDTDGKHYHGMVIVDPDGHPVQWRYMTGLLEQLVILLGAQTAGAKDEEREGTT